MYLGVDIGGTKTLVAALDENGVITEQVKFATPKIYDDFLDEFKKVIDTFPVKDFSSGAMAMPVTVFDRKHGIGVNFGNLPWRNVPIHTDIEHIVNCPVTIENDAKLACLSESMLLKDRYSKVLYVTVSTGIGYALTLDNIIDRSIGDGGGRVMMFEHDDKLVPWETFASGHAIVERYGKMAQDITDTETWQHIARDLSRGFLELIAILEPEVVVVGGSVGVYFDRFGKFLSNELQQFDLPLLPIPPIIGAQRPDEAVVYGCYDLAKQVYDNQSPSQ